MGKASRGKSQREEIKAAIEVAIADQKSSLKDIAGNSRTSSLRRFGTFMAGTVFSAIIAIPLTLLFAPSFAQLISLRSRSAVTVSYVIQHGQMNCDYYMIGIHPQDKNDTIKSLTLHLQFPGAIQSLEYGTDHSLWKDGKTAIEDKFDFELPCDVKAAISSDLPASIQIRQTGQAKRDVVVDAQNLDASSSFMLVLGVNRSNNPRLTYTGQAIYSAWNQDIPARINLLWMNGPK